MKGCQIWIKFSFLFQDNAVYEHTGLPDNSGTITVTSQNVQHLTVTAYLYGLE